MAAQASDADCSRQPAYHWQLILFEEVWVYVLTPKWDSRTFLESGILDLLKAPALLHSACVRTIA
jgi:hypothetical protein